MLCSYIYTHLIQIISHINLFWWWWWCALRQNFCSMSWACTYTDNTVATVHFVSVAADLTSWTCIPTMLFWIGSTSVRRWSSPLICQFTDLIANQGVDTECDQIYQKGSYECTISRYAFHHHSVVNYIHQ